jgi:hypothetical protein
MMVSVLDLLNQVLRRAGQSALTNLTSLSTPAKQSLDFLAQIYSELLQTVPVPQLHQTQVVLLAENEDTIDLTNLGTSSDLVILHRVLLISPNGLNQTPLLYLPDPLPPQTNFVSNQPTHFSFQHNQLVLLPTPTQATTLSITYIPSPESFYNTNGTLVFPQGWERVLVLGTLAYLQQFLGESNANNSFLQYMNAKLQLKAHALKQADLRFKGYRA